MANDVEKVIDIANKITAKAEGALHGLDREMTVMKWPPEFRLILWGAVADMATRRMDAARATMSSPQESTSD